MFTGLGWPTTMKSEHLFVASSGRQARGRALRLLRAWERVGERRRRRVKLVWDQGGDAGACVGGTEEGRRRPRPVIGYIGPGGGQGSHWQPASSSGWHCRPYLIHSFPSRRL